MTVKTPAPGDLETIETASRDEIAALQLQRLQWSLSHAYENVAHYRKSFDAAGVHPSDLKSLSDLQKFPFLYKDDFRANYPFGLFAVPKEKIVRVHASSGTTGKPTVVGYTRTDIDNWALLMARSIRAAGGRSGDMCHVAYGYGLFTGGLGAHYGAECLGCTVIPMSGGQTEKQIQLILDFKPSIVMATPSYFLNILDELEREGVRPCDTSMRVGIFGAEPWTEAMRTEIERRSNIDAIDLYGLSEVMGPGVACECIETKDGPTLWEDHFYAEIINPRTGEVVPDGEEGELVFTTLTKEGQPVIRYRTRDLTRLLPPTSRSFRRIAKITGRSDDMLIIRGVNVFPTQIEELILKQPELSPHYEIEVRRETHLDEVDIRVELAPQHASMPEPHLAAVAKNLQHSIKTFAGISTRVRLMEPGALTRSMGKAKRVFDKRHL